MVEKSFQLKGGEPAPRKTGVDRVLELLGGEPAKNKTGVDRIVEILEEGGGGGSSLPSYTSEDKGKVLTVGEGSETVQTVIVPRQTFSLRGNTETEIDGDPTGFVVGREYECYYGAGFTPFTGTMTETDGKIGFKVNYQTEYGSRVLDVYASDGAVYCKNNESSDMGSLVSFEVNAFVPKIEPIWGQSTLIVNVAVDMDTQTMTCDKTAAEIYSADRAVFIISAPVNAKCQVLFDLINPETNGYAFGIYLMSDIVLFQAETASDYPVNTGN